MRDSELIAQAVRSINEQASAACDPAAIESTPETVALSILALEASGLDTQHLLPLRQFLASWQGTSGAVAMDPEISQIYWPTGWAVLAWHNASDQAERRESAASFLLNVSGVHRPPNPNGPLGHDTSLRGWPWTDGTHSWVQPTSVALMALDAEGRGDDERVTEAVQMLLNRQLPDGGWNYGNTRVFRNILKPIPEDTGYALTALRPHAERRQVELSLAYLGEATPSMRAPAALAWSVLGLSAWGVRPESADLWLEESLARQARIGAYPPRYLALLVIAHYAKDGLDSLFLRSG